MLKTDSFGIKSPFFFFPFHLRSKQTWVKLTSLNLLFFKGEIILISLSHEGLLNESIQRQSDM